MAKLTYTVGICSGYFDPLHVGHVEYLNEAKNRCNYLVVIVNTDNQAVLKKGFSAICENDRLRIVKSLKPVDYVVLSVDTDGTVCKTIEQLHAQYNKFKMVFFKGGDRFATEIPEAKICNKLNIKMQDGLGKKIDSSTRINAMTKNL